MVTVLKILRWMFFRLFGLLDLPKIIAHYLHIKGSRKSKDDNTHIYANRCIEIDQEIESMDKTKSCPHWYRTKVLKGMEISPNLGKTEEYWICIQHIALAPIIPIPISIEETVYRIGTSLEVYERCFHHYGEHWRLMDHANEFGRKLIQNGDVFFHTNDKMLAYQNAQVWSSYD